MDNTEYQKLINEEKWLELSQTNIITYFSYKETYKELTITKEMLFDFLLDNRMVNSAMAANTTHISVWVSSVYERVVELATEMGLTPDEWKLYIDKCLFILRSGDKRFDNPSVMDNFLESSKKPREFFEMLKDDVYYKKITDIFEQYGTNYLNVDDIKRIGIDLIKEIGLEKVTYGGKCEYTLLKDAQKYLGEHLYSDPFTALIELRKVPGLDNLQTGYILGSLPQDVFEKKLEEEINNLVPLKQSGGYFSSSDLVEFMYYYKANRGYTIPDDLLEKYMDITEDSYTGTMFLANLTIDQVTKYMNRFAVDDIAKNRDIPLSLIAQHNQSSDAWGRQNVGQARFYTEEEIAAYPQFFNPNVLKKTPRFYITRKTWSLLNKAWGGKRYRYNEELTDFLKIIWFAPNSSMTMEDVKYLKEKTGVSNTVFADHLKQNSYLPSGFDDSNDESLKNLRTIKNIIQKHGDN